MSEPLEFELRLATDDDVSRIRELVNSSYKELLDRGLNFTASYQDDQITRDRMSQGRTFVLENKNRILASVIFYQKNFFTGLKSAYVSQLAVHPDYKKQKLGTFLMSLCENLASKEGFDTIQLDTAKTAYHLVHWYQKRGYRIVGMQHWEGKTYESWIFEKNLNPILR